MTFEDAMSKVTGVFQRVLDAEGLALSYETTANDIEDWDSLTHIELVVGIEKTFGIKFTLPEVQGFRNVGEMVDGILKKAA